MRDTTVCSKIWAGGCLPTAWHLFENALSCRHAALESISAIWVQRVCDTRNKTIH